MIFFFSRKNSFSLYAALDETGKASGDLFWDDGNSIGINIAVIIKILEFKCCKILREAYHYK